MCFDSSISRNLLRQKGIVIQIVTISFFRFEALSTRLWAFTMMGIARVEMSRIPNLDFWKLCGSGTGEGFTPRPNTAVYAILCVWPNLETAEKQLKKSKVFDKYRKKSNENWTIFLGPASVRGEWAGKKPFDADHNLDDGPIAALTRATIKPSVALRFWKHVPAISNVIGKNNDVMFKIGIGEVPFFHQITFSIWPDVNAMAEFARRDGPHARAIESVRKGLWFKEELYARFKVIDTKGTWNGNNPISIRECR
jgi:spheroidene monooxygenase